MNVSYLIPIAQPVKIPSLEEICIRNVKLFIMYLFFIYQTWQT